MREDFRIVGIRQQAQAAPIRRKPWYKDRPVLAMLLLFLIVAGCLACELFVTKDPSYMDLGHCSQPPCKEFLFGTDAMGRDMFAMVWYGGRISLTMGIGAALISAVMAVILGAVSGSACAWVDTLLMKLTEIMLSVPGLLLIIFIQAVLGEANVFSLAFVIGITGWMSIAQVVRTEVRQMRHSGYVTAARCMGGGFWHVLWRHLLPNLMPSILFMVVMNIRNAIVAEATLSFMGIGLPVETISWGSMLSGAEKALLTNSWWIIVIPGFFLVATLLCITSIGNYLRMR